MSDNILENPIKALLFDHDDTLVGTVQAKWAQHRFIAKTFYDKDLSDEELRLHWGKPFTLLVKLLYETDNIDMAMLYNIATRKDFPKHLFDDTIATLTALKTAGYTIGLVTAATLSSLANDFSTLSISKNLFDYIQTEDDTVFHKPDSRVFIPVIKWLSEEKIKPNQTLYIGDSLSDMKAALGAGFQFLGVETGLVSGEEFKKNQSRSVSSLSELLSLFARDQPFHNTAF